MSRLKSHFLPEFYINLKIYLYLVFLQQIARIYYIFSLKQYIGNDKTFDIFKVIIIGLQYDVIPSGLIFILLMLKASIFTVINYKTSFFKKFDYTIIMIFVSLILIANVLQIEFFKEFKDNFNETLFEFYFDDTEAIFSTIFKDISMILHVLFSVIIFFISWKVLYAINNRKLLFIRTSAFFLKTIGFLIVILAFIYINLTAKGGLFYTSIDMKDKFVTKNHLLNKCVLGCLPSLKKAIEVNLVLDKLKYKSIQYEQISFNEQLAFYNKHYKNKNYYYGSRHVDTKILYKNIKRQPKHIFFIIGESLDIWPLLKAYNAIKLYPNINKIMKTGFLLPASLPISDSTVFALNSISTNLPDFKVHLNYKMESYKMFFTAIVPEVEQFGYQTRFFFGGNLLWQNMGSFIKRQGFKKIYGAKHIAGSENKNEWGVDDELLFNFVIKKIKKYSKTFNLIMTTSNHPPYTINIGNIDKEKDRSLKSKISKYYKNNIDAKKVAHHWYNDKCIGKFIKILENKYNNVIFLITGDHFSKRHILNHPSLYEKSAIPIIIYSRSLLNTHNVPKYTSNNHLDIFKYFLYLASEEKRDFFYTNQYMTKNCINKWSAGNGLIISSNYILRINNNIRYTNVGSSIFSNCMDLQNLRKYYRYYKFVTYKYL